MIRGPRRMLAAVKAGEGELEERWRRASPEDPSTSIEGLQGLWRVERLTGPLPMTGIIKEIDGVRGITRFLRGSLGLPFELRRREGSITLIYRPPLSFMADELRLEGEGLWLGRATVAGRHYAWFRMVRIGE